MQHASWRTKIPAVAAMGRPYRQYLKVSVRLTVFNVPMRPDSFWDWRFINHFFTYLLLVAER